MDFSGNPQNTKSFSYLIPSYLLKVTKFLGKTSQFEFLVMTEKNIFAYKLFLSLNMLYFILFFMRQLQSTPPQKSHPLFPSNLPLKLKVLSSPPLFENLVGGSTPPCRKGGGPHYEYLYKTIKVRSTHCNSNVCYK